MAFCRKDLRWLVAESSTLSERLAGSVVPGGSGLATGAAGRRLRKWRESVARGDSSRFDKRLQWEGLNQKAALALLGPVRLKDISSLPEWARLLDDAARAADGAVPGRTSSIATGEIFDARRPQPFEDVLQTLIPEAERRLVQAVGKGGRRLSRPALIDLERGLLKRLCDIASRTLCTEFEAFRSARTGTTRMVCDGEARQRELYRFFAREMGGRGFTAWLLRYPMLARLLATGCQQWVEANLELLRRLDDDARAIRSVFDVPDRTLRMARVEPGLSDPHCGGRTVSLIRFESGAGLVYKPRRVALEARFADVLQLLEGECRSLHGRQPVVLDRGDYGWIEPLRAAACRDRGAVERFYERAGMLTCLAHVLGGSDLHADNLIAVGEHPVIVDLECMVGAPLSAQGTARETGPAADTVSAGSVLRTGMAPFPARGADGVFRLAGGLADPDPHLAHRGRVKNVNTDCMTWQGIAPSRDRCDNLPSLAGRPQRSTHFVDQILEGFRAMYAALRRDRQRLARAAPIRQIESEEFRVVIRTTRTYFSLLGGALAPQHLESGADWSIALDMLAGPALGFPDKPACWATRDAERRELEQLDIPVFRGSLDRAELRTSWGTALDEELDCAGRRPSTRIVRLDASDLVRQLRLLRMSFSVAGVKQHHREVRTCASTDRGRRLTRRQTAAEVCAMVDLLTRLVAEETETVTWYGFDHPLARSQVLSPVGASLFSGTAGIGLFLATAARLSGSRAARELAARVLDPLCVLLGDPARRCGLATEIGIGGGLGLGGLVYALVRAGTMLGAPTYLDGARNAADAISRAAIDADGALDVLGGAAGALLGLLALHRATADPHPLQRAIWCGEHLLANRTIDAECGLRTWCTRHGRLPSGFAHGTGGIGYALQRLSAATGEGAYRRTAAEAWTVERNLAGPGQDPSLVNGCPSHHLPSHRTWSWCRGWSGFGLARLAALDDRAARADIQTALSAVPPQHGTEPDSLCCGRLGRADLLLTAGLRLNRDTLCDAASALGRQTVARALREGRYATGADDGFRPGLFQGLSGIGYQLLRLQEPATVPSVLLWE